MFEEFWGSQKDMGRHLRFEDYLKVLLIIEVAVKAPEICFDTISNSAGIETIEKTRKHISGYVR